MVEKQNYLLALSAYIVLNPVRAKMVTQPGAWLWSSYRAMVGQEPEPEWLDTGYIREQFGGSRKEAIRKFQEFVSEQAGQESPWDDVSGQMLLGGQSFIEEITGKAAEKRNETEIPRAQRYAGRPTLKELFAGRNAVGERNAMVVEAHVKYGYKQNEIARQLAVHYATISKIVKRGMV